MELEAQNKSQVQEAARSQPLDHHHHVQEWPDSLAFPPFAGFDQITPTVLSSILFSLFFYSCFGICNTSSGPLVSPLLSGFLSPFVFTFRRCRLFLDVCACLAALLCLSLGTRAIKVYNHTSVILLFRPETTLVD